MINFTPLARAWLKRRGEMERVWAANTEKAQLNTMLYIVRRGRRTRWGSQHVLNCVHGYESYKRQVPIHTYEDFRPYVMRMLRGESSVLWPGVCTRFAQSSGTSDGKSKYIPVTDESLRLNHYAGSRDAVAQYLRLYPDSRMFSGQALILGGSYANELDLAAGVRVGDLSAHLIDNINPVANRFRVPSKEIALMEDWGEKLPRLVESVAKMDITNISGVPSWFLTVLKAVIAHEGASTIHDVWPSLEVFFHGGISFKPYRDEYSRITDPKKMRYIETYNASEGFFATQSAIDDPSMLLLMDVGVFYEFVPVDKADDPMAEALPAWEVEPGATYALIISACNGLYRYLIGDTVRVESVRPLKISIVGRTRSYINVFGEELMVYNADAALSRTCAETGSAVVDYTAGPVMPGPDSKGRHHWMIEWATPPADLADFARRLDLNLQAENSDYQAKRSGDIFLDCLTVETVRPGVFNAWLASTGKLGGQRKVPRLSNTPDLIDQIARLNQSSNI